jgi:hypothetical protein
MYECLAINVRKKKQKNTTQTANRSLQEGNGKGRKIEVGGNIYMCIYTYIHIYVYLCVRIIYKEICLFKNG